MKYTIYYGYSKEEYIRCQELINEMNKRDIKMVTLISCIGLAVLGTLATKISFLNRFQNLYFLFALILIFTSVIYRYIPIIKKRIQLQAYLLMVILLVFASCVAIYNPSEKATAFPAFLTILPMLFIDNHIRMSAFIFIVSLSYTIFVLIVKDLTQAYFDIFSVFSFGGLSMITHYFFNCRVLRSLRTEKNMRQELCAYKMEQVELKIKAQTDPLTGLLNREAFVELAKSRFDICYRGSKKYIFGILDVDHFKDINDTYGHQAGDETLIKVSQVLRRQLRNNDIVGRLGGDEFIFLLLDIDSKDIAASVTHRMLEAINQIEVTDEVFVNASIGITQVTQCETDFEQIYYRADKALYRAKELGRNQISFFETE